MGNTHDTEIARLEADFIHNRWKTTGDYRWGYSSDRGPESWWVYYPSASGNNQSPIDIITEDVTFDPDLCANPLQIHYEATDPTGDDDDDYGGTQRRGPLGPSPGAGADGPGVGATVERSGLLLLPIPRQSMELINSGNTATIDVHNSQSYITGGPCRDSIFRLRQIQFHWGEDDDFGSEHLINNQPYAAEVHLVHWNEELFSSYEEAVKKDDGIVILAIFVQVSEGKPCRAISLVSDLLQDVAYRGQRSPLPGSFNAGNFLPDDVTRYWTYRGSFTAPPCFETVTWIVLNDPIQASSIDLHRFRQLRSYYDSEVLAMTDEAAADGGGGGRGGGQIVKNRRGVQPLGTRTVYAADHSLLSGDDLSPTGCYELDPFRPILCCPSPPNSSTKGEKEKEVVVVLLLSSGSNPSVSFPPGLLRRQCLRA